MATPGVLTPTSPDDEIVSPQTLFPFMVSTPGNYTSNYTVWAGSCVAAKPPLTANQRTVTVAPGATASATGSSAIPMPGMVVSVTYQNGTAAPGPVKPAHIELTDSCGQTWQPAIDGATTMPTTGWLDFPGQPYGTYSICADYRFQGTSTTNPANFKKVTLTGRAEHELHGRELEHGRRSHSSSTTGFC